MVNIQTVIMIYETELYEYFIYAKILYEKKMFKLNGEILNLKMFLWYIVQYIDKISNKNCIF